MRFAKASLHLSLSICFLLASLTFGSETNKQANSNVDPKASIEELAERLSSYRLSNESKRRFVDQLARQARSDVDLRNSLEAFFYEYILESVDIEFSKFLVSRLAYLREDVSPTLICLLADERIEIRIMVYHAISKRETFLNSQAIPLLMRELGRDDSDSGICLSFLEEIGEETLPYLKSYYEILKRRVRTTELNFLTLNPEGYSDEERHIIGKLNRINETIAKLSAKIKDKEPSSSLSNSSTREIAEESSGPGKQSQ